jgi:hypothetical protein
MALIIIKRLHDEDPIFKNCIENYWKGGNKSRYNLIIMSKSKILVERANH